MVTGSRIRKLRGQARRQDFRGSAYGACLLSVWESRIATGILSYPPYEKRSVILVGASAARIIRGRFINFHSRSIHYEISLHRDESFRSLRVRRFWKDSQDI